MKILLIVAIIFAVQVYLVQSRTIDDVLQDFQPIFSEIHTDIGKTQSASHVGGQNQENTFSKFIFDEKRVLEYTLKRKYEEIQNHMRQILAENGLTTESESIQHCISQQQIDTQYMVKESDARTSVCEKLGTRAISKVKEILNNFYDCQANMHETVEASKKKCIQNNTPLEVQSCLIQELYFVHKPQVKELEKEVNEMLQNNEDFLDNKKDDLKVCFSIVNEDTDNSNEPVKNSFKNCVVNA